MRRADIVIRAAASGDAATVADIGAQSFREAYAPHATPEDLESHVHCHFTADVVRAEIERANSNYLLAVLDDAASGIAKYRVSPCPAPGGDAHALELQQLYILASRQGVGLGQRLLAHLVEIARWEKARGIWLSAWEFADWATRFYARNGFAAIGKVDFQLGKMTHTDLLMWMPLD